MEGRGFGRGRGIPWNFQHNQEPIQNINNNYNEEMTLLL